MPDLIKTKTAVVRLWLRVEQGAFLDKVLPELRRGDINGDLAEYLLRGMLDHKLELLWAAGLVYTRFNDLPPRLRALLLLSIFQLRYSQVPAPLIVSEAVNTVRELKLPHLTGVANAGLRKSQLRAEPNATDFVSRTAFLAVITSLPEWILELLQQDYPTIDPLEMVAGYRASRRPWLRRVRQRYTLQQLEAETTAAGVELMQAPWNGLYYSPVNHTPAQVAAVKRGDMIVHDVSAAAAVELLAPTAGDRVLDCCAAPGGKLRQLLELQPQVSVTAVEKDSGRFRSLGRLLLNDERIELRQDDLLELQEEKYDCILLDVPCSGSGNYGKKPDSRYRHGSKELAELLPLQQALLSRAAGLLAVGGRLVYSTCSLFKAENEQQVAVFLREQPEFRLVGQKQDSLPWSAPGQVKFTPWEHHTGGAFAALLTR